MNPAVPRRELASFLPMPLLARLPQEEGPCEAHFAGCALFLDISGFTPLTERLAQQGPRGSELLSRLLDDCFGGFIRCAAQHGGSLARTGGDSLLFWWAEDAMPDLQAWVLSCALALRARPAPQGLPEGVRFALKIGLGCGTLWAARLGGRRGRWEFLLGGSAVHRACQAERLATTGEIVLGRALLEAVGPRLEAAPRGQGFSTLERFIPLSPLSAPAGTVRSEQLDEAWVRGFLPPVVSERLVRRHERWLAELRRLSVVFACIEGLGSRSEVGGGRMAEGEGDGPGALQPLQRALQSMQAVVDSFAGHMEKLVFDDKGLVFLAAFGLPGRTHPDDAARATEVAMAIERELRTQGLHASLGVATGRAYCGPVGCDERREYMLLGPAVNMAARLMQAAGSGVLCCPDTVVATQGRFAFRHGEGRRLRGIRDDVQAFRPTGRVSKADRHLRIFGRDAERRRFQAALDELRAGRGGVIALQGTAGMGKSFLVQDLLARADEQDQRFVLGSASAVERGASFRAWRAVFRSLLGAERAISAAALTERVRQHAAALPELTTRLPLLSAVLPVEFAESEVSRGLMGPNQASAVLRFLCDLLMALCPGPLLLVLEDCHWMDSASWRLAEAVAKRKPELLLVLCSRPVTSPVQEYEDLARGERFTRVDLGALDAQHTAGLVQDCLGGQPVDPALAQAVFDRTGGNPLFAREFALLLRDANRVTVRGGRWHCTAGARELATHDMPTTVEGMITSRIDQLPPVEQLVLKTASVIGRGFSARLLGAVYPVAQERQQLRDALDNLVRLQLLERSTEGALDHAFHHDLVRDVAYGLMLFEQRRDLHRAVANWFEEVHAADLDPYLSVLAHHCFLAKDNPRALRYAEGAGSWSLQIGAYREAIVFLTRCLDLAPQLGEDERRVPRRLRWRRQMSEACQGLGDTGGQAEQANLALRLAGRPLPLGSARIVLRLFSQTARMLLMQLLPTGWRRFVRGAQRERLLEMARAYSQLTSAFYFMNQSMECSCCAVTTLNLAERAGPSVELARAFTEMGGAFGIAGMHRLADRLLARGLRVARDLEDPIAVCHAHMLDSLYRVSLGQWRRTCQGVDGAQNIAMQQGHNLYWTNAQAIRFWMHHYQGDHARASEEAEALLGRARLYGNRQHEAWGLRARGLSFLVRGHPGRADKALRQALEFVRGGRDLAGTIATTGIHARTLDSQGQHAEAMDQAQQTLHLLSQVRRHTSHICLEGIDGMVAVFAGAWERERDRLSGRDLERLFLRALSELKKFGRAFPIGQPRLGLRVGQRQRVLGRDSKGRRALLQGLRAAERLGMDAERARLTRALGADK